MINRFVSTKHVKNALENVTEEIPFEDLQKIKEKSSKILEYFANNPNEIQKLAIMLAIRDICCNAYYEDENSHLGKISKQANQNFLEKCEDIVKSA